MTERNAWTLNELKEEVGRALRAGDYVPASSARVRAVPDGRTIRYYTTLGLIDRAEMKGRVAHYGRRHLLQVVAIKRLQAQGLSLTQVQERLGGCTDAVLEGIASLPDGGTPTASPRRADFWAAAPAPVGSAPEPASPAPSPPPEARALPAPSTFTGLPLASGASLLIEGPASALDAETRSALLRAAAPLLTELRHRGIIA